jgi:hypothetical protein
LVKAVALTCTRCSGKLLAHPGVALGVCNPCSTAFNFSTGEKKEVPVLEAVDRRPVDRDAVDREGRPSQEVMKLPFIRFEAEGAGRSAPVFVMVFGIAKIGTPYDDGSKLTVDAREMETRPGSVDAPPELSLETAAALARFLALRVLDPDGRAALRPEAIHLRSPAVVAVPFRVVGATLVDPISGMTIQRTVLGSA